MCRAVAARESGAMMRWQAQVLHEINGEKCKMHQSAYAVPRRCTAGGVHCLPNLVAYCTPAQVSSGVLRHVCVGCCMPRPRAGDVSARLA